MARNASAYGAQPLWQTVAYLPAQLPERSYRAQLPELRLVAAMLDDAVQCIWRNRSAYRGARRREFLDAYNWVWDDARTWPFAFANVCDLLSLDPRAIRHQLRVVLTRPDDRGRAPEPFLPAAPDDHDLPRKPRTGSEAAAERERFAVIVWDEA